MPKQDSPAIEPKQLLQILKPDGQLSSEKEPPIPQESLIVAYYDMVLTRILDEKLLALQRQGRMGTYVSCSGQEATQIGTVLALSEEDWVFSMYRDLGMLMQRKVPLDLVLNKLFGNEGDTTKGRDLPNAFGWRKNRVFSVAAPIASHLQLAVGFAMAAKYKKEEIVTVATFGDGATSSSEFHVSMNFAGVFKAPALFICENNQYAISLPVSRQTASDTIAIKARAYGFEGVRVDGNDLLAVYSAVKTAGDNARMGNGPTLIECVTYRLGAHSTADDWKKYRSVEEVEEWRKRDPISRVRSYMVKKSLWSEKEDAEMRRRIEAIISESISKAESMSLPQVETMFEDVYAQLPRNLKEGLDSLREEKDT